MKKQYVGLELNVTLCQEEIVRTSSIEVDGKAFYGDDGWFDN